MASLMEVLIDVLDKENQEYARLLTLSMRKTPVIVSEDLDELARITDEEQIIVSRINHLDNQRNEAINDIANVLNKDVNNLKIVDLIKMLAARPEEQEKLAAVFDSLQENVRGVKRINEQNRELLQEALELVQFNMNVLPGDEQSSRDRELQQGRVQYRGYDWCKPQNF